MIIFNIITKGITRINIPPGLGYKEGIIIYYYSFKNKDYHTQKRAIIGLYKSNFIGTKGFYLKKKKKKENQISSPDISKHIVGNSIFFLFLLYNFIHSFFLLKKPLPVEKPIKYFSCQ